MHLARHGLCPYGTPVEIEQGVEMGRPSQMRATAHGDGDTVGRIEVAGSVVVVAHGEMTV
nr:PhzF family phenazine biosynthesis protein [Pseudonocardia sp. HH130630-07]